MATRREDAREPIRRLFRAAVIGVAIGALSWLSGGIFFAAQGSGAWARFAYTAAAWVTVGSSAAAAASLITLALMERRASVGRLWPVRAADTPPLRARIWLFRNAPRWPAHAGIGPLGGHPQPPLRRGRFPWRLVGVVAIVVAAELGLLALVAALAGR